MPDAPATLEDVLAALEEFKAAALAEQAARDRLRARADALADALARYRGGATSADLTEVTAALQSHAARLEQIARP